MPDLVKVENLVKYFPVAAGNVHAVDDVSFAIKEGETLGLVGESGCGKSTTGRLLIRLIEATSGRILYRGRDIASMDKKELHGIRKQVQIIFQDPFSSLDPRKSIGETIGKPLEIFGMGSKREREEMVDALMEKVGLSPRLYYKYPHELDGGRRQRVGIARALSLSPDFIVCDEPVSALDVSVQAQVVNLLMDLQAELGIAYLFVAHDLAVVRHISHRVAVMYLGHIVEIADRDTLFSAPRHPYTEMLLAAVPVPDPRVRAKRLLLTGDLPSPADPPPGCRFHTRCPLAQAICREQVPPLEPREPQDSPGAAAEGTGGRHWVACHFR